MAYCFSTGQSNRLDQRYRPHPLHERPPQLDLAETNLNPRLGSSTRHHPDQNNNQRSAGMLNWTLNADIPPELSVPGVICFFASSSNSTKYVHSIDRVYASSDANKLLDNFLELGR